MNAPLVPTHRNTPPQKERIVILGSTGSIGTSALDVVRANRDLFDVVALVAGRGGELLVKQAEEFRPRFVAVATENALKSLVGIPSGTEALFGENAICELCSLPEVTTILASIVGVAGLAPVLAGIRAGKKIALANKESLVAAGDLVRREMARSKSILVPVDSEHSALFQCLTGNSSDQLESLILTASGGPFLDTPVESLVGITPAQAVKHPKWNMGAKISIDSSTLVNKALELIEASFLFGVNESRIQVVVHPQSIVHSLVEFRDGTQLAQLSNPDMKGAIAYALRWPAGRLDSVMKRLKLEEVGSLTFRKLDSARFPAVSLARSALNEGGGAPAIFNMANEVAVGCFLGGKIRYTEIVPLIEETLSLAKTRIYTTLDELTTLQEEVRLITDRLAQTRGR